MRALALGGILGPLVFVVAVVNCGFLRPDYSHVTQFINELGATGTPNAALMNYAGFVPGGVLLFGFGISLEILLPRHILTTVAATLLTVFGVGVAISGVFPCDAGCPGPGGSFKNLVHDWITPITFLSAVLGAFFLGMRFWGSREWRPLSVYSVITGVVALGLLLALMNSIETRTFIGFWQRSFLAVIYLWCAVVGLRLAKLAPNADS